MKTFFALFFAITLCGLNACSIFRATGDTVQAVGEGTGHAVSEVGHGAGHAVTGTGRALGHALDDIDD